ncbi:5265c8df-1c99-438b-a585-f04aab271371 [Sclerotinia trifoliorum]|uniref:5265c8df-1c99-438b-a585-f04aab271371 n=1 Tax=Sclerotinia trifoliorum TaxID=28548 RepID=A0A8H2ZVU3_9HELO|nr:5265c8df-1c99-438b-a585-f04aab271371 [Sclerotinia trifoliorum]
MESTKTRPTNNGAPVSVNSDVDIERSVETGEAENEILAAVQSESEKQNAFALDFPDGGARAWSVALGAAGVLFCTFGYINAFGVYQEYYQTHQLSHRTPSDISWIGSLQVFFLFSGSAVGGPLFDRYGGKTIWPAALLYVFSVMMTSLCKEYYQFMLAQGVLGGIATGMTMSPGMTAVGQYFDKQRGAAMGITVAGSSIGGVVFPIALAKMFANPKLGFGWTVRILGFIMLAVLGISCTAIRSRLPPRKKSFFLPSAFKELPYITLLISAFLMILGVFIPIFYLPTYAVEYGMSTELASYLVAILNGASFFGRVIPGVLADKVGRLNMFCAVGISTGILVFCWQSITSNAGIIVFAAIYGFCSGAIVSLVTVCFTTIPKNPQNIGTYMGMGMAVIGFAALIGPPINGALVDHYHSFNQVADFSGVMVLVGGIFVLVIKYVEGGLFKKI